MSAAPGSATPPVTRPGTPPARSGPGTGTVLTSVLVGLAVIAASLVLGGVTSYGQTYLPDELRSFANSASGWTFLTALLVWAARRGYLVSALLGAASFVALVFGYVIVTELRGYPGNPVFWSVVGVVAGPFIGLAAAAQWDRGRRRALGAGLLAGIAVGEGCFGLTEVLATTSWVYWTLSILIGVVIAVVAARALARPRLIALLAGATVGFAALFWIAYRTLSLISH